MAKEPEITVTCSIAGCQCGGILPPEGMRMRAMKGPASFIGPSRTAILAPAIEGRSFQSRLLAMYILCPSAAGAAAAGALAGAAAGAGALALSWASATGVITATTSAARRILLLFMQPPLL